MSTELNEDLRLCQAIRLKHVALESYRNLLEQVAISETIAPEDTSTLIAYLDIVLATKKIRVNGQTTETHTAEISKPEEHYSSTSKYRRMSIHSGDLSAGHIDAYAIKHGMKTSWQSQVDRNSGPKHYPW